MKVYGGRLVVLTLLIAAGGSARAQQPAEFLNIENTATDPITVRMKSRSRASKSNDWQEPITVRPGSTGTIQLKGFEPFDISIQESDGRFTLIGPVNLCAIMRNCARTGQMNWRLRATGGRWVGGRFRSDPKLQRWLDATADEDEVTLEFTPALGEASAPSHGPQDDPLPLPRRPRK